MVTSNTKLELLSLQLQNKKPGKWILSFDCFGDICICMTCGSLLENPETGMCFNCGKDDWNEHNKMYPELMLQVYKGEYEAKKRTKSKS